MAIIPFTKDGVTLAAHITFGKGIWNSKDLDGSIAVVEDAPNVVYSYSEKKKEVTSASRGNWAKQTNIPFDGIQGFHLPMTLDVEISESVEHQLHLSQANSSAQMPTTTHCKTVKVARIGRTVLGFVAYKFWQQKYFCYDGVSAVSNVNVSTYVSNMDSQHYYRGVVSQWNIRGGDGSPNSMRQGQIST